MVTPRTAGTIDIDGLPVFYETEGDGEPLVLLHGGLADNSTWAAQFEGSHLIGVWSLRNDKPKATRLTGQASSRTRQWPIKRSASLSHSGSVRWTCSGGATGEW